MSKRPERAEEPISIEEQQAMLESADASDMPEIPASAIVMEDQKPERFKEMMGEGTKEDLLMQSLEGLPDRILDTFRDG